MTMRLRLGVVLAAIYVWVTWTALTTDDILYLALMGGAPFWAAGAFAVANAVAAARARARALPRARVVITAQSSADTGS